MKKTRALCGNCMHYEPTLFADYKIGDKLGEPCDSCKFTFIKNYILPSHFKRPPIPLEELTDES